jgi:GxxExxY protein
MTRHEDPVTREIIAGAITVSKFWGNGILESVYKRSLVLELKKRGFDVRTETPVSAVYDGVEFDIAFRTDIIVNHAVIIEAKAVTSTLPVHRSQLLTYMRLSGIPTGLLMNFHAYPFTQGITRLSL